ncbi:MAG: hypothetical protein ACPMAQ_14690, partial [Phycisphaerae bacterium]
MRLIRVPLRRGRIAGDLCIAVRRCHVPVKEAGRLVRPASLAVSAGCVVSVSRQHLRDRTLQEDGGGR